MTQKEINYLGSLLHDIGKFKWRAQERKSGEDHETLGTFFIREYLGKFQPLKVQIEELIKAANRVTGKIWKADIIAAQEREQQKYGDPRRPLISIFQRLSVKEGIDPPDTIYYYNPQRVNIDLEFPINSNQNIHNFTYDENDIIKQHEILWKDFIKEIENIKQVIKDYESFFETFYSLLEKYTSYVLSAGYKSYPDIPLFDHSRVVSALSVCYDEGDDDNECILIEGDISGIQDYIYQNIYQTNKVAKKLRGRSFYISLLGDTLSNYILRSFNLLSPNLLYNGGGHFLILVPNNKSNQEIFFNIEKEINSKLHNKFGLTLQLILGKIEASGKNIIINFNNCYKKLNEEISCLKKNKSFSIIKNIFEKTYDIHQIEKTQENLDLLEQKIGEYLPLSNYIVELITEKPIKLDDGNFCLISFEDFNIYWILTKDKSNKNHIESLIETINNIKPSTSIIYKINDTDFLNDVNLFKKIEHPFSLKYKFFGTYVPINNNKILSFEELSKIESENYPLLAVSRLDMDFLGAVFAFGFPEDIYSISRIAYLSRELNNYFCGYINKLAEKYSVYIAYSGGDDVFAVGSWINIINFVIELRDNFDKFVCENKNLSISCGIALNKKDYPIEKLAKLAGYEEKKAKEKNEFIKDNISFLGISVDWNVFKYFLTMGKNLLKIVDNKNIPEKQRLPRSFIHNLLNMTQNCFDDYGNVKPSQISKTVTRLHYFFARRNVDEIELKNKTLGFKTTLAEYFIKPKDKQSRNNFYKNFMIAAAYVLYKTRN